jgi:hypothetical protein
MLRDTFALRYLQARGDPRVLQCLLGLNDLVSVKRYQNVCGQSSETPSGKGHQEGQEAQQLPKRRKQEKRQRHSVFP